jgi:cytoskeletal protein CcmA (bactofilin family)
MIAALPFLGLFALTLAWFLLPLLPALREFLRPTDIAPLKVVDRASGNVAHFARNFRRYLEQQVAGLPAEAQAGDFFGRLPDGTPFLRVHKQAAAIAREAREGLQSQLVVIDTAATLDGGETFMMELYARAPLIGGPKSVYRAVYAERELLLGEDSAVLRWAHACGRLTVGDRSTIRGRLSSDESVRLGGSVVFERIGAPVISVGEPAELPPELPSRLPLCPLPEGARTIGNFVRIEGDFIIPEGTRLAGNVVIAGHARLGLGALVEGSIKAHGELVLSAEARVRGAAVTRTSMTIGPAAWVEGPAIAEERLTLGRGAIIGSPDMPATASAPVIELAQGATVYGQISAMGGAHTL